MKNFKQKQYNLTIIYLLCIFIATLTLISCKHSEDIKDNYESSISESNTTVYEETSIQEEITTSTWEEQYLKSLIIAIVIAVIIILIILIVRRKCHE